MKKCRESLISKVVWTQSFLTFAILLLSAFPAMPAADEQGAEVAESDLAKIAMRADYWDSRIAALDGVHDNSLLADVAVNSPYWDVSKAATQRLIDDTALVKVATQSDFRDIRRAAIKKIEDDNLVGGIAREEKNPDVRRAAVQRVTQESLLKHFALEDEDPYVRLAAVRRITDENLLRTVSLEDEDTEVRCAAVRRVTEDDFLKKFAQKECPELRLASVKNLTDQKTLQRLVLEDDHTEVRSAALRKVTDNDILREFVRKDNPDFRSAAAKNLKDEEILRTMAVDDDNAQVQCAAVQGLIQKPVKAAEWVPGHAGKVSEVRLIEEERWGKWQFEKDPQLRGLPDNWFGPGDEGQDWKPIDVPAFWGQTWVGDYLGYGWYRTTIEIPDYELPQKLTLLFGAIDEQGWLFFNGHYVGEHSINAMQAGTGTLWDHPFEVRVDSGYVNRGGENVLHVLVHAARGNAGIHQPVHAYFSTDE